MSQQTAAVRGLVTGPSRTSPTRGPSLFSLLNVRRWPRIRDYFRWRRTLSPMLLHTETWDTVDLLKTSMAPPGTWWLRRPLALAGSPSRVYLTSLVTIARPCPLGTATVAGPDPTRTQTDTAESGSTLLTECRTAGGREAHEPRR